MLDKQFRLILSRFFLLIIFYSLLRFIFYFFNSDQFIEFPKIFLSSAFLHGIRFDIAAIAKLNIFFFIIWLLPFRALGEKTIQTFLKWVFILVNTTFISANLVDVDLIQFTGQRMTVDFWSLGGDWLKQAPQLLIYYWKLSFIGILFLYALIFFYPDWDPVFKHIKSSQAKSIFAVFSFLLIMALSIRGGLQHKPLSVAHANVFPYKSLNDLVLNSTFTMLHPSNGRISTVNFVKTPERELFSIIGPSGSMNRLIKNKKKQNKDASPKYDNVVVIIMESFALEYTGFNGVNSGYTPFLNQLARKSMLFQHHFSNGRRSIEAMPSILCSIPSLQKEPFLTSPYQSVDIKCLPQILKSQGYESAFFHGAANGTMFFDSFAERIGFDHYWGLDEYPDKDLDFDGSWGIYDEPFFQFTVKKIGQMKEPFFTTFFSLSSHQPYSVPEKIAGKFPKGTLEIHESVGYADYALEQFFKSAQGQSWYKNTLFIITADHTQKSDLEGYNNVLGHYKVPLIIFHPSMSLKQPLKQKVTQHVDIQPSVLHWLGVNEKLAPFGQSVFENNVGYMINYDGQNYYLFDGNELISFDGRKNTSLWNMTQNPWASTLIGETQNSKLLKSYVQFYLNGLIKNKWYK